MRKGQSLIELLIGLGIGVLAIGATTGVFILFSRTGEGTKQSQIAGDLANSLLEKATVMTEAGWRNIYDLSKGSAYQYFVVSTGTTSVPVLGKESVLGNDIVPGLIANWKFDESDGLFAFDSSGLGNKGSLINSPTRQADDNCKVGRCLNFSNSYVEANTYFPSLTNNFTISFWVKPGSSQTTYADIFGNHDGDAGPRGMVFQQNSTITNQYNFGYGDGTSWAPGSGNVDLVADQWQYVTIKKDSQLCHVYVNGQAKTLGSCANPVAPNPGQNFKIGLGYTTGRYFNGSVDDFRIYDRILSDAEIMQLYNSPVFGRYFYIDNVSRSSGQVVDQEYNPVNDDPSTQKITVDAFWTSAGAVNSFEISAYATRWLNNAVSQTDWSSGGNLVGPISEFGSRFATSTGINFTDMPGSIRIQNLNVGGGGTGSIDSVFRYAWNDASGWLDLGYPSGVVTVGDTQLTGYAYNSNLGEIALDCATTPIGNICSSSDFKVSRASNGDLSGWAWSDRAGWISFNCSDAGLCGSSNYKVNVNTTSGAFTGWAWSDSIGWISFNCVDPGVCGESDYRVNTIL